MAEVKWIKIVTDIFDDEKIMLIESLPEADSIIVVWFKLLCLAGKQNNSGVFMLNDRIPYTDEMIATVFRRPLNTVRLALRTFEKYGMIEIVNNTITIPNWEKHQSLDALERSREKTRERVQGYRDRQKLLAASNDVTLQKRNVTQTEEDKSKSKSKSRLDVDSTGDCKGASRPHFTPPTLDEVAAYCKERDSSVDPKKFFDYFDTGGWIDSKGNHVKNWKQKLITWESAGRQKEKPARKSWRDIAAQMEEKGK